MFFFFVVVVIVSPIGLIVAGTVFLLAQLAVISIWTYLYQRRRKQSAFGTEGFSSTSSFGGMSAVTTATSGGILSGKHLPNSRTESMCKLYDNGFQGGRHGGRQF